MSKSIITPEATVNREVLGLLFREARVNPCFAKSLAASEWLQKALAHYIVHQYQQRWGEKSSGVEAAINEFVRLTSLD